MSSKEKYIRAAACNLIKFYQGVPGAVDILITCLDDPEAYVRSAAIFSLSFYEKEAVSALPKLVEMVQKETDIYMFPSEITTIAAISSKEETIPLLRDSLDGDMRYLATQILNGYKGVPGAVELLIEAMGNSNAYVRALAASNLSSYGDEAKVALPDLIKALKDPVNDVRSSAARSLGHLGKDAISAVPFIIEALKTSDTWLVWSCEDGLRMITGQDFGKDVQKWTDWWNLNKNNY